MVIIETKELEDMEMCRNRKHGTDVRMDERTATAEEPYEGKTIRLDARQEPSGVRAMHWHRGGFPWWTLWLIWPLFGLVKGLAVVLAGAIAAVASALPELAMTAMSFWPVVLIPIGILLFRRK